MISSLKVRSLLLGQAFALQALAGIAASETIDFQRDVAPILKQACADCHAGSERNGGIAFDQRDTLLGEADSGLRAIVPGDPAASELMVRVQATDEDVRMPPEGTRLSSTQVRILKQWIAEGAKWNPPANQPAEDGQAGESGQQHWAFVPPRPHELPEVEDPDWPLSPMDAFVQARREAAGLAVVGDASPEVLVRRAAYVLTGLPPSPNEVQRFLSAVERDGLQVALANLTDRLLQSPAYGERWGRHWMDWVRYADTAGDNSDFPIPQAYLYRKYIIDALNEDVPYDQFLIEQLAGDLLPAADQQERNRLNIATGYLAMARRFGSLVERYPWHLTIEDTIDNVGRTMMGLTLSCARCHDHKFDPLTTRDYYGLYGIFASTRYPQPGLELFQVQQYLVPLIPESEIPSAWTANAAKAKKLTRELEKLLAECDQQRIDNLARESSLSLAEQRKQQDELDKMLLKARKLGEQLADHLKKRPEIPAAYAVQDGDPQDARLQLKGEPARPGATVPRGFPEVLGGYRLEREVADSASGRLQLAHWIAGDANPLTARVIVNRVWERHFGKGIVASTSDFGLRGQLPSHPELLDWLALDFIAHGWSLKHLHRRIMLSRTWQLASQDSAANLAVDPGNTLLWKMNRRRMDAESLRDALLLLAGNLDGRPQAEPYPIPPQRDWKYTQHHPFKDDYPSQKRSVYLMTKRLTGASYFQTFDGPDPNVCTSERGESVTPLQALYFVNDAFFHSQAEELAANLIAEASQDSARIEAAYLRILARHPDADERTTLEQYLQACRQQLAQEVAAEEIEQRSWSSLVRSLLRLNEFLYID